MANLFGRDRKPGGPRSASRGAPCRQGAGDVANLQCPRETAAEKEVSERPAHANREAEVEKGGAVVSPPSVERRKWHQADVQMAGRRRGMGRDRGRERMRVSKAGAVNAGTGKKEPPAVGLSKRVASVECVGSGACV